MKVLVVDDSFRLRQRAVSQQDIDRIAQRLADRTDVSQASVGPHKTPGEI